jgi:uncharacterized protein YaiE (UPF0345 family)
MRSLKRQRGFLLNPYRFAGTVQAGAFASDSAAASTLAGAAVAGAEVSAAASAAVTMVEGSATTLTIGADGVASMVMAGASIAATAADSDAEAAATFNAESAGAAVDAADFDGTNDYLTRGSFTGQADSKLGILAVWFQLDTTASLQDLLSCVKADATLVLEFSLMRAAASGVGIYLGDSTGTILQMNSSISLATGTWYNLLASWNVGSSLTHLYINDIDRKSVAAGPVDRTVPMTTTQQWSVGSYAPFDGGGLKVDGGVAEVYFAPGQYLDFSVEANRRKFISALSKPVSLGATGSTPTGTAPLIYLHMDDGESANNFATNRTSAGNLTVTGALTTRATSPSD